VVRDFASHRDGPGSNPAQDKNFYSWLECLCLIVAKLLQHQGFFLKIPTQDANQMAQGFWECGNEHPIYIELLTENKIEIL
jgi:hypothetical protein